MVEWQIVVLEVVGSRPPPRMLLLTLSCSVELVLVRHLQTISLTWMWKNLFDTCVVWSCVTRCRCGTTSSTLFTVNPGRSLHNFYNHIRSPQEDPQSLKANYSTESNKTYIFMNKRSTYFLRQEIYHATRMPSLTGGRY